MSVGTSSKGSIFFNRLSLTDYIDTPNYPLSFSFNLLNLSLVGIASFAFALISVSGIIVAVTGASAFLSCVIAIVITAFPGACIVEFATKFPSAGSIFTYTHATIGESIAYLVGINIVFDVICQAAFTCKSASVLIDKWTNISTVTNLSHYHHFLSDDSGDELLSFFDPTPDWKAGIMVLMLGLILIFTILISISFFNILTVLFLLSLLILIISGFVYGNRANLTSTGGTIFKDGFRNIVKGVAASSFLYGFYDVYSVSAEESHSPQENLPKAMLIGFSSVAIFLILITTSISYLVPNNLIDLNNALFSGFENLNVLWAARFTDIISIIGMIISAFIALYVSSRYLFAIARDGLLPSCVAYVQPTFKSPLVSVLIVTFLALILAIFLSMTSLVTMSQFGCVIVFFTVGIDLLIFRYMPFCSPDEEIRDHLEFRPLIAKIIKDDADSNGWMKSPIFFVILLVSEIICMLFAAIVFRVSPKKFDPVLVYASGSAFSFLAILIFCVLCMYKPNPVPLHNEGVTLPFLPLIPILSIIVGVLLAMDLRAIAWGRFVIISSIGLVIYFIYRLFKLYRTKRNEYEDLSESADQEKFRLTRGSIRKTL